MKTSEIKYSILKKAVLDSKRKPMYSADEDGLIYLVTECIGIVVPYTKDRLEKIIKDCGAVEDKKSIELLKQVIRDKEKDESSWYPVTYTGVCFDKGKQIVEYFKILNDKVAAINLEFLKILQNQKLQAISGKNEKSPIFFYTQGDATILIMPVRIGVEEISLCSFIKDFY